MTETPADSMMSGDQRPASDNKHDKTEALRMWSAMSFVLIILIMGIPLWWKTTEVYRVALPYEEIEELKTLEPRMLINLSVFTEDPSKVNTRIVELSNALSSSKLFDVQISPGKVDGGKSVAELEEIELRNPLKPGSFKIIESKKIAAEIVILGNHRSLYFHPEVKNQVIVDVVKKWVLRENYLEDMVGSMEQPGNRTGQERRLKSEPCFDIVFTTVNPEPEKVKITFDTESTMVNIIEPLIRQLKPVADIKVKSQWLYFVNIGQEPKKIPNEDSFVISSDRIPHIISPLEKKLGSGVSSCPCLHFVLYIPRCSEAPLFFASPDGSLETAVVSPRWGGIQIHNPPRESCVSGRAMSPDVSTVVKIFVSHLRYLLDMRYDPIENAKMLSLNDAPLRNWEVDSLYRSRILEQAISARLTLQSLSRLLGEISNIVINEEVGDAIKTSVSSITTTMNSLAAGRVVEALGSARTAYVTAEMAFSHPSLLALLYFPDDQKYAVYIPLFLPVMIPVVLSLKTIWRWLIKSSVMNEQ